MAEAIRLTFCLDEGKPKLMLSQVVDMRVACARQAEFIERKVGTWIETRNAEGHRLFARRVDSSAFRPLMEVRSGVGSPAKRLLHVIIPRDPEVASFHLLHREDVGGDPTELLDGRL